jgi:hypothetical protein
MLKEESPVCMDPRTEYIALLRGETNPWPMGIKDYEALIEYLSHSPKWQLVYDKDQLLIFRRVIIPFLSKNVLNTGKGVLDPCLREEPLQKQPRLLP